MGEVLFFGKSPSPSAEKSTPHRRILHVMLCKGMNRPKIGIYKLLLDDHYYIGRAEHIRKRVKQHMRELQVMLNSDKPKNNYQRNMLKYLKDHPSLEILNVEILEECAIGDLQEKEDYWLNKLGNDKKCLNVTLTSKATWKDKARLDFKKGIYVIEFDVKTFQDYTFYKGIVKDQRVKKHSFKK